MVPAGLLEIVSQQSLKQEPVLATNCLLLQEEVEGMEYRGGGAHSGCRLPAKYINQV